MQQGVSEMSEKLSEAKMRELIATVAGPVQFTDNRKSWLSRAARNSGLTFRQVKALFYGEITDPYHKAARKLKDAAVEAGRKEARSLADQFETIAGGLNARDEDFYREDAAALISAARALRALDRPRTKGGQ
jgi:hypothetical protein